MHEKLDDLLIKLRKTAPEQQVLGNLEERVWLRIGNQRREEPSGWHEHVLAFCFSARYRLASVVCAFFLGSFLGFFAIQKDFIDTSASDMLNFKVFKPKVISLAYSKKI